MKNKSLLLLLPSLLVSGCGCHTERALTFNEFQLMVKDSFSYGIDVSGTFSIYTSILNVTENGDSEDVSSSRILNCSKDSGLLQCDYFASSEGYVFNMENYKTYVKDAESKYVLDSEKDARDVNPYIVYNYVVLKSAYDIADPQTGSYKASVGKILYTIDNENQTLFEVTYHKYDGKNRIQSLKRIDVIDSDTKTSYTVSISSYSGTVPEVYE